MQITRLAARSLLLPLAALVAIAAIVFSGSLSSAQTPDATPTPDASPTPDAQTQTTGDIQSYDDLLAEELNVSVDELREAQANARDRYFDQLEREGRLTAEQAANLKATSSGDVIASFVDVDQHILRRVVTSHIADRMGIDRQTLDEELADGRTLEEIASDRSVSTADIRADLEGAADQIIGMAQQAGLITADEAADLRQKVQEMRDRMLGDEDATPATTPGAGP